MRDTIIAVIRTMVQGAVAFIVAWLADYEILVNQEALEGVLFVVTVGVVTLVLNWLQAHLPWVGRIMSLGMSNDSPSYDEGVS